MKRFSIFFVLIFVTLCGCGGGATVKGTVKFDDGTPLTVGAVKFLGEQTQAVGLIGSDGTYTMYELQPDDGVKPGRYQVVVSATTGGGVDEPLVHHVDPKFERPETSGLTCEVKGSTIYDITVSKPAGAPQ